MHTLHEAGDAPVVIVGGGVAGLATALNLAPHLPVTLVVASTLGREAATALAQGGIAAAIGEDDEPALHAADTCAAGAGLCDTAVVERITAAAPACIAALEAIGVPFDRDAAGRIALGLEAAHSRHRIVHAGGDGTGRAVIETLAGAARRMGSLAIMEETRATGLILDGEGALAGVRAIRNGLPVTLAARAVVLATGGIGALYDATTNPLGAVGSGLALAARAGASVRDVEFVQFHPTAIDVGLDPMPLASEAVRGEGAVLVNGRGERFMAGIPGEELAPRDVVARAIWRELQRGQAVYLDAREALGARFPRRFPTVTALCRNAGVDPVTQPIPVRPAAHYHMGGIAVDARGRSSIEGLYACGEVAATGLHGANRLASNSLLEALAYARWIAEDIQGGRARKRKAAVCSASNTLAASNAATAGAQAMARPDIRRLMSAALGVIREGEAMQAAIAQLRRAAFETGEPAGPLEIREHAAADAALVGLLIATAAVKRRESRGGHYREDFPRVDPRRAHSFELTIHDVHPHLARPSADIRIAEAI